MERVTVGEGIIKLVADTQKAAADLQQFGAKAEDGFNKLGRVANAVIGTAIVVAATRAAKAMWGLATEVGKTGEELMITAQKFGMTVEQVSRLQYAAKMSNVSFEQLGMGFKMLAKNASEADQGNADLQQTFDKLGISVKDTSGKLKNGRDLFLEAADAISRLGNSNDKVKASMDLFGRSGEALLPVLQNGRQAVVELENASDRMGLTWSTKTAEAAAKFDDAVDNLTEAWKALKRDGMEPALPVLEYIVNQTRTALSDAKDVVYSWAKAWADSGGNVGVAAGLYAQNITAVSSVQELFNQKAWEFGPPIDLMNKKLEDTKNKWATVKDEIKNTESALGSPSWSFSDLAKGAAGNTISSTEQYYQNEETLASNSFAHIAAVSSQYHAQAMDEKEELDRQYHEHTLALAQEEAANKKMAALGSMGSIAEGMQAVAGNNVAMAKAAQLLSWVQGVASAASGWAQAFGQGGIYGFAAGAAIFAKIMALLAIMKGNRVQEAPRLKVPGAAEGGIIFKPSVIAVAEKRPEIVAPLDKLKGMMGGGGGGKMDVRLSISDKPAFMRAFALEVAQVMRTENLVRG